MPRTIPNTTYTTRPSLQSDLGYLTTEIGSRLTTETGSKLLWHTGIFYDQDTQYATRIIPQTLYT